MPHAAFMPLRTAPKAALAAHRSPTAPTIPVMALALTTRSMVPAMKSVSTGMTEAISIANSACCWGELTTKPAIDMKASTSGKNEKRA